jgi:hypothetical protein
MKRHFLFLAIAVTAASAQTLTFEPVTMSVGNSPVAVRLADLTGNGLLDIAVINGGGSDTVSVLLNLGGGQFSSPTASTTGGLASMAMTVGDFNHDGKADLAVVNNLTNNVSILLGNGDGTFHIGSFAPVDQGPVAVTEADFNGDGNLDLAVVNSSTGDITILLGRRDGTFGPGTNIYLGSAPTNITAGDFNGDGIPDLAVTDGVLGQTLVYILLGNGDGTFQSASTKKVGDEPFAIVADDFNHNGYTDLAVANLVSNTISVLLGDGNGEFQGPVNYKAGNGPIALKAGKFTQSGNVDLVACDDVSNEILVFLGRGNGMFREPQAEPTGSSCNALAVGDLFASGVMDIVATTANGLVLFSNTSN